MAKRPVFVAKKEGKKYVDIYEVEFQWFSGFAKVQKQKSIDALHNSFRKMKGSLEILEISSKSKSSLGILLSAFNLSMVTSTTKSRISVESAFQGSKVFKHGGPYEDLLYVPSIKAKKDERLRNSGELLYFNFFGQKWPLEPKTLFYDWIYLNALHRNQSLSSEVVKFKAFTDIEFNPEKSINCQAHSAALFVALSQRGLINKALSSPSEFKNLMGVEIKKERSKGEHQIGLPGFN